MSTAPTEPTDEPTTDWTPPGLPDEQEGEQEDWHPLPIPDGGDDGDQ